MWSDNETSEDLLGFKVHADLLIDVINDNKVLPVTIGVFGDWGSGKSSILKIIKENLEGEDGDLKNDTLVLYFNGWLFEGYDDAKAALLESIIEKFEEHKTIGSKVKDSVSKLLKSVKWMRVLGLGFKKVVIPTTAAYLTGGVSLLPHLLNEFSKYNASELANKLTSESTEAYLKGLIKDSPEDETTLVRKFREDFKEMIDKSEIKKLVVIIDDLDRCTPDRIIENLEAIKLFLNVDKTAFIIGADPRIVRHAIDYRYKKQYKIDDDSNNRIVDDYLEKLIQIPYYLPRLSDSEVETYISLLVCERELEAEVCKKVFENFHGFRQKDRYSVYGLAAIKEVIAEDGHHLAKSLISIPAMASIITQTLYGNPRQIKRFLNTLTLRQRLATVAKITEFDHSILTKLMVLEYSELTLFKQLYDWQSTQNGIPKQIKELEDIIKQDKSLTEVANEIEKQELLKGWNKSGVVKWLKTEPYLASIDLSDYFWLSRDKIASSIPGASLIPPIVRTTYQSLNQDSLTDTVSKSIIKKNIISFSDFERSSFLEYCSQILIKNPKKSRAYAIFHLLIDENVKEADLSYVKALGSVNPTEIPPAIGEALKRYTSIEGIRDFIDKTIKPLKSATGKLYNLK